MEDKQKSVVLTFLLSAFPGAGHYYLGLMNRGLQFMLLFIGGIFLGNSLDLPELAAFLPVVWFYALFDALQMAGAINSGENIADKTVIPWNHEMLGQKTIGWALIVLGILLIVRRILPSLVGMLFNVNIQTVIVAILLIVAGFRILKPGKNKSAFTGKNIDNVNGQVADTTHTGSNTSETDDVKRGVFGE